MCVVSEVIRRGKGVCIGTQWAAYVNGGKVVGGGGRRKASQKRENKLKETITLATQATVNPETFAGEIF